jgi:hypothetical protein
MFLPWVADIMASNAQMKIRIGFVFIFVSKL